MCELTNGAVQQRAQELHFGCQLGQAVVHGLVVQDGLVKHFPLTSVVNSFLYHSFQRCQDLKKQSTEQDVILARSVLFLLVEKDLFFTLYKKYIRLSKVNYSIGTVWGAVSVLKEVWYFLVP